MYLDDLDARNLKTSAGLGALGLLSDSFFSSSFDEVGYPYLPNPVSLGITQHRFSPSELKIYKRKFPSPNDELYHTDSLNQPIHFFKIKIADQAGFIKALNADFNKDFTYTALQYQELKLISEIWIRPESKFEDALQNYEEATLLSVSNNYYKIKLVINDNETREFHLSEGDIVAYKLSEICWALNDRKQTVIGALGNLNSKCPGNSKSNPRKVKSKDIFDKL